MSESDGVESRDCAGIVSAVISLCKTVDKRVSLVQWLNLSSEIIFCQIFSLGVVLKYFLVVKIQLIVTSVLRIISGWDSVTSAFNEVSALMKYQTLTKTGWKH